MNANRYFIVCPKAQIKQYSFQEDRDYFSAPVEVQLLACDVSTRLLRVRDPRRNHEYPADKANIRSFFQLTNKQRLAIR